MYVSASKSCKRVFLVGATNLVARCRCDLRFRATWYVAPTDCCINDIRMTFSHLLRI